MRLLAVVLGLLCSSLIACQPVPTYVECEDGNDACDGQCVDLDNDPDYCGTCDNVCELDEVCDAGTCVPLGTQNACAINNGGCSLDAMCMDIGGVAACACNPGFIGDGMTCDACTLCDSTQYVSMMCTPFNDTVCTTCAPECGNEGVFESVPCGPFTDRVCTQCTQCGLGTYTVSPCMPTQDRVCAACDPNCVSCDGPGSCFQCDFGFVLMGGTCVAAVCGNAVIEGAEECDDGDMLSGDGCSSGCTVEPGNYCFGEVLSICRAGSCVTEAATALPLGAAFELDGDGNPSGQGLTLTQRSMIRTTAPVQYPMIVEATVVYNDFDVTYAGARGNGLRDLNAGASEEPTDNLRARFTGSGLELATGPGVTTIASTSPLPFTVQFGVPYRIRYIDDGFLASVEVFNLTNPAEGVALQELTSYHGSDDRAFVGGGDQAGATFSDIRVCSAPVLPVTSGLVAHYSAIPSWTVQRNLADFVTSWLDQSGNGQDLAAAGTPPRFSGGLINSQGPGLQFIGGGRLATTAFALSQNISVFVVMHHTTPDQWGAIAHHGSRDNDWSMEQSGDTGDPNTLHWQTNNDNVNMELTLTADTSYVMTGIFNGLDRYFSSTTFSGTTDSVAITDASHTITSGDKVMYVGTSDNNEASNANIGALLYFNRALSSTERDDVIAYLRALWRPQ